MSPMDDEARQEGTKSGHMSEETLVSSVPGECIELEDTTQKPAEPSLPDSSDPTAQSLGPTEDWMSSVESVGKVFFSWYSKQESSMNLRRNMDCSLAALQNYLLDVFRQYNQVMAELASSRQLYTELHQNYSRLYSCVEAYRSSYKQAVGQGYGECPAVVSVQNSALDASGEVYREDQCTNITRLLSSVAAEVMASTGDVYDEQTGLYYNTQTKLYYDQNTGVYTDPEDGVLYRFCVERNRYVYYGSIFGEQSPTKMSRMGTAEASQPGNQSEPSRDTKEDFLSDGEIPEDVCSSIEDEDDSTLCGASCIYDHLDMYPPCIRATVVKSTSVSVGTLFVVTCKGATITREEILHLPRCLVLFDKDVGKPHASISYEGDEVEGHYVLQVLSRTRFTELNNTSLVVKGEDGCSSVPLSHRDFLTVGSTTLSLHIHPGRESCDGCEPGQVMSLVLSAEVSEPRLSKEALYRSELKRMKKKYHITGYETTPRCSQGYQDRARTRREKVGSDPVHVEDRYPASTTVDRPIDVNDTGRRLLERMGWKEGCGLGKHGTGRLEPVRVEVRSKNLGLGSTESTAPVDARSRRKQQLWSKMEHRYRGLLPRSP